MPNRAALVTIALGDKFRWLWRRYCRPSWLAYADRHGYDLIVLEAPLDPSPEAAARMATWQKCLVLSQPFAAQYEQMVWVDADILIHPQAPAITTGVPPERVGAVDEYAAPSPEAFQLASRGCTPSIAPPGIPYVDSASPAEFYGAYGLPPEFEQVVQAGVLVLSPRHHRTLLERVYADYAAHDNRRLGEMRPLTTSCCAPARCSGSTTA